MKARNIFFLAATGIFLLWLAYPHLLGSSFADKLVPEGVWVKRGVIGDSFGALNSLFAGLGLAGLLVNLYLQTLQIRQLEKRERDNELQLRQQIEYTRTTALLNYYNDEMARLERLLGEYQAISRTSGPDEKLESSLLTMHSTVRGKRDGLVRTMEAMENGSFS